MIAAASESQPDPRSRLPHTAIAAGLSDCANSRRASTVAREPINFVTSARSRVFLAFDNETADSHELSRATCSENWLAHSSSAPAQSSMPVRPGAYNAASLWVARSVTAPSTSLTAE